MKHSALGKLVEQNFKLRFLNHPMLRALKCLTKETAFPDYQQPSTEICVWWHVSCWPKSHIAFASLLTSSEQFLSAI